MIPSGAVFFILISAVLLAAALAWVVAALYQRGMLALMRGGVPPAGAMISENQSALNPAAQLEPVTAAETNKADLGTNRHASVRLMLVLSGISLLIALTQSYLALFFIYQEGELSLNRVLLLGAIYAWPMVLAWGLARRCGCAPRGNAGRNLRASRLPADSPAPSDRSRGRLLRSR